MPRRQADPATRAINEELAARHEHRADPGQDQNPFAVTSTVAGYALDVKDLFRNFSKSEEISFKAFKQCWKDMQMSVIFRARPLELTEKDFMLALYAVALGFLQEGPAMRTGVLYCLFLLYNTQFAHPKHKISLTPPLFMELRKLQKTAADAGHIDAYHIFERLKADRAFMYCAVVNLAHMFPRTYANADLHARTAALALACCPPDALRSDRIATAVDISLLSNIERRYAEVKRHLASASTRRATTAADGAASHPEPNTAPFLAPPQPHGQFIADLLSYSDDHRRHMHALRLAVQTRPLPPAFARRPAPPAPITLSTRQEGNGAPAALPAIRRAPVRRAPARTRFPSSAPVPRVLRMFRQPNLPPPTSDPEPDPAPATVELAGEPGALAAPFCSEDVERWADSFLPSDWDQDPEPAPSTSRASHDLWDVFGPLSPEDDSAYEQAACEPHPTQHAPQTYSSLVAGSADQDSGLRGAAEERVMVEEDDEDEDMEKWRGGTADDELRRIAQLARHSEHVGHPNDQDDDDNHDDG